MKLGSRGQSSSLYILACSFWLLASGFLPPTAPGQSSVLIAKSSICQEQDVETLTTQLLKDLPSYANRVSQRARYRDRTVDLYSYVLLVGHPEFAPLTLGPGEYNPASLMEPPQQVFITTLERQYIEGKPVELQQYHWLFFTQTSSGWRLAMMFSRIGAYPAKQPPTRPRDSSNGVIAQAIRTWLRDCQAGSVRP
jgi:hypothetical protein